MSERRWHPWRDLRGRPHIELGFDEVAEATGGAFYGRIGDRAAIVLAPGLDQVERRCALAHELVHDERQVMAPEATPATMELEEERVRRAAADRLVPTGELIDWLAARVDVEGVTVAMVAEEFDVTAEVAAVAVRRVQALMLEREMRREVGP